jgi:nitric oxide reductase NorD protein
LRYWQRSQQDGDELDLDAWIRLKSDITRNALSAEEGLYQAHIVKERDLACLLLADLSISTDAYISNDLKIIDVIRNSLFLFSEALSSTGDRLALYGFSSLKRSLIRFHQLKSFDEKYEAKIRGG